MAAGLEAASFRHGLGAEFMDVNGDGRPDLYIANDEDPNELYVNVPWPGGARPTQPGSASGSRSARPPEASQTHSRAWGSRQAPERLLVTNSRGEPSAAYRRDRRRRFVNDRPNVDPALGSDFAGWGASWVDLTNSGRPDLVLTAGAIPVTSLERGCGGGARARARTAAARCGTQRTVVAQPGSKLNGRGLAVADAWNDGRMEIAINTIGGKLVLLQPTGAAGHWLDVALTRFSPGAVVTVVLPGRAGSSTRGAGRQQLSLVRGSARALRPR